LIVHCVAVFFTLLEAVLLRIGFSVGGRAPLVLGICPFIDDSILTVGLGESFGASPIDHTL